MTELFMHDKLNERWPDYMYADDLVKALTQKKVSQVSAQKLAYLFGEVEDVNRANLARFHMGEIIKEAAQGDWKKALWHETQIIDITPVTTARAVMYIPQTLGFATQSPEVQEVEADFYEGLSFQLMAWARKASAQGALKALKHDQLETRAKVSRTLYAMINGLCQDGVIKKELGCSINNPSYFWLMCEASMHLSIVQNTKEGRSDNMDRARLVMLGRKQGLPTTTDQVEDKDRYARMDGIIRACADKYAQGNDSFKRSRWARFNKALADWVEQLGAASKKNSPTRPDVLTIYGRRKPRSTIANDVQGSLIDLLSKELQVES